MRATGIIRRIDDLGRIVIPKEIRRSIRINEGDALEIFTTNDGAICLKPYEEKPLTEEEILNRVNEMSREEKAELIKKMIEIL